MNRNHMTRIALAAASMATVLAAQAGEADPFVDQTAPYVASAMDNTATVSVMSDSYALHGDAVAPEQEAHWAPTAIATRDEVKQELSEMRLAGALSQAGEIAEPRRVLMARQQLNEEQAESLRAAYLEEQLRLAALEPEVVFVALATPMVVVVDPE